MHDQADVHLEGPALKQLVADLDLGTGSASGWTCRSAPMCC